MLDFNFNVSLNIDRTQLRFETHDPNGMIGRHLKKRARMFVVLAKSQAGKETGKLASSIKTLIHERTTFGQRMVIGSRVDYAYYVHEGTRPHEIHPRDGGIMRFSGAGRVVYTHQVNHPGTKANKYLSSNLWVFRI